MVNSIYPSDPQWGKAMIGSSRPSLGVSRDKPLLFNARKKENLIA